MRAQVHTRPFVTAVASDGPAARASLSPSEALVCETLDCSLCQGEYRATRLAVKRAAARLLNVPELCRIQIASYGDAGPAVVFIRNEGGVTPLGIHLQLSFHNGRAVAVATRALGRAPN